MMRFFVAGACTKQACSLMSNIMNRNFNRETGGCKGHYILLIIKLLTMSFTVVGTDRVDDECG